MEKRTRLQALSCLILLMTIPLGYAAEIQVAVDRNPVGLNESFQITFTASEEPDGKPDFAPLQENFEILNQQRSSNASWVNGQSSRSEQWALNVMARQAGDLLIPPIAFGADSSKPLTIKVSDSPQTTKSNDEVFLEVEATPEKPYVQSQVLYTLKLYRRVQITQASLNDPDIKDALVEKLGDDNTYATQVNGVDYWITERKYAIFPQQSGMFTIAPLTLTAEVLTNQRPSFNGFFNRQVTETRRVSSKAITLNVLPAPQQFKGSAWLNADSLELNDSWSDKALQVKVGEPLTRTITLSAKGTTVGQLPELAAQTTVDGIKTYPDQPVLKEDKLSDGITARREEKIAYIPAKAGEYTLPEIQIDWFNSKTGKMETARLPAVTIKALAAVADGNLPPKVTIPRNEPSQTGEAETVPLTMSDDNAGFWQWLSGFLALGWSMTVLWFYKKRSIKPAKVANSAKAHEAVNVDKSLRQACFSNDPQAAKQVLLLWGKTQFASDSLASLAVRCAAPLAEQVLQLNRVLYSPQQQAWSGQSLWQAFSMNRSTSVSEAEKGDAVLEPLYKI